MASGSSDPRTKDEESTLIKYALSQHPVSFGLGIFFTWCFVDISFI